MFLLHQRAPEVSREFLTQSQQPRIWAAVLITYTFAVFAVAARLWCRWTKKSGFKLDDALILVALLAQTTLTVDAIWLLHHGIGRHIQLAGPRGDYYFYLGWFVGEVTYTTVIIFVKFSIIALYWRLFSPLNIKWEIRIMATITFLWGAAGYICMMQHCVPLRKYWDHEVPGVCNLDNSDYFFSISIPNIIIDVALLALPIRHVMRLEMDKRQKQAVVSLFLVGGIGCVMSVLRLVSVLTSNSASLDPTWAYSRQCIWGNVETNVAIICGCLPCLAPVFSLIWPSAFAQHRKPSGQSLPQWTIGSEPRKKRSGRHKYSITTDGLLLSTMDEQRLGTPQVPEGRIKVMNEYSVEGDGASNTSVSNRQAPWAG